MGDGVGLAVSVKHAHGAGMRQADQSQLNDDKGGDVSSAAYDLHTTSSTQDEQLAEETPRVVDSITQSSTRLFVMEPTNGQSGFDFAPDLLCWGRDVDRYCGQLLLLTGPCTQHLHRQRRGC